MGAEEFDFFLHNSHMQLTRTAATLKLAPYSLPPQEQLTF